MNAGRGGNDVVVEVDLDLGVDRRLEIAGDAHDTSVMSVLHAVGAYEPHVVALMRAALTPASVVLDVGANIGVHTLAASALCPRGRVFAFEPSSHHLEYLRRNVAANDASNVTIEPAAAMDAPGEVTLSMPETFQAGSFVSSHHREGVVEHVPAITIDWWARGQRLDRCDFMKVDVEGCERFVLAGAKNTIERFQPLLLVECNAVTQRRFRSESLRPLYRDLGRVARDRYALRPDGSLQRLLSYDHLDRLVRDGGLVDVLCVPPSRRAALTGLGSWRHALQSYARLGATHNRFRCPSRTVVYDPSYELDLDLTAFDPPLRAAPGDRLRIPVKIRNTGRLWLSDRFSPGPTTLSYRWSRAGVPLDGVGGPRTPFGRLRPGTERSVVLRVDVDRDPGRYELDIGVVQQDIAWLVDLAPALARRLPIIVG